MKSQIEKINTLTKAHYEEIVKNTFHSIRYKNVNKPKGSFIHGRLFVSKYIAKNPKVKKTINPEIKNKTSMIFNKKYKNYNMLYPEKILELRANNVVYQIIKE